LALFFPVLSFAGFFRWKKLKIDDWFGLRVIEVSDNEFGEEEVDELVDVWALDVDARFAKDVAKS
jgi:hypothetical protein